MWLCLRYTNVSSSSGKVDLIIAIVLLLVMFTIPVLVTCCLWKHRESMSDRAFKAKFDSLYQNVDYFKKSALAYPGLFLTRRILFAFTISFFSFSIVFQVMIADFMSTVLLGYYFTVKPMRDRLNNFIQIFNELAVLACIWLMFHFTHFVGDPETRYELAWYFLYFVGVNIAVNFLIFLYIIVKKIYNSCRLCCLKRKAKKLADRRV